MHFFFHFLCNRLIIRDAFLCFFYTVGLIHDVFITCYFTAYKVTIFLGYNQKNSEKIGIFSLMDGTLCMGKDIIILTFDILNTKQ